MPRRKTAPTSVDALLASMQRSADERLRATIRRLRTEIFPRLRALGVTKVAADYSGYGDSGAIDFIDCSDATGQPVDVEARDAGLIDELRDVAYEFLPDGFEINDGGQGDLVIDVTAGTVKLDHDEHYTASRSSSREWRV